MSECLRRGVWQGLRPAELAAVVSAVVFESRRESEVAPHVPEGPIARALADTVRLWGELTSDERRHHLSPTREPDLGFAHPVHRWASGDSLTTVLAAAGRNGQQLSAGDVVRWCRQVVDLLDQVRVASGGSPLADTAAAAVTAVRRGVVALGTA